MEHRQHGKAHGGPQEGGPGGGPGGQRGEPQEDNPVEAWQSCFWQAYREVYVELFKERIRRTWGRSMESVADAFMKSMDRAWKATWAKNVAEAERQAAQKELMDQVAAILSRGVK